MTSELGPVGDVDGDGDTDLLSSGPQGVLFAARDGDDGRKTHPAELYAALRGLVFPVRGDGAAGIARSSR